MAGQQQRHEKVSAFKIHIKNLPENTSADELKAIFEEFGKVVEAFAASYKNFGFIYMEDEACGRAAITMLNGRSIRGSVIGVEESTLSTQGPSVPSTRLKIKNIPSSLSALGLRELFTKYGIIISVEINGTEGIVVIEAIADIRSAMKDINGYVCDGQTLVVEPIINTGLQYNPKTKESPPSKKPAPLMKTPQSKPTFNNNNNTRGGGRGMSNNAAGRSPRMRGGGGGGGMGIRPLLPSPMRPGPPGQRMMGFRPPPQDMWNSDEYSYNDMGGWGEDDPTPPPPDEGKILRDPYGPGLRPQMPQYRRGSMMRPSMGFQSPRPQMMMRGGGRPGPGPAMYRQPLLGRGGGGGRGGMMPMPQRPLLREPGSSSAPVGIEPLFHRRHEILTQERQEPNYAEDEDTDNFYEDIPLDQVERIPIYSDSNLRMGGGASQQRAGGGMMGHSSMRSHPPLQPPPMPPMLFRNGMGGGGGDGQRVKRISVPEADPGQPFEVPPMIPPGMFQPPRKYFANRPKPPNAKRKKLSEPKPEPPIPEQPSRYVPDYSNQQYIPQGAVLKPFPPPQYNDDFSEDVEFQEQQEFY